MEFNEAHILAYIKGELSEDAQKEYDELLQTSPEFRMKVEEIRSFYSLSEDLDKQRNIDTLSAWEKLHRKMMFFSFIQRTKSGIQTVAAIVLPLFLLYQYVLRPVSEPKNDELITLFSAPGVITKTMLPDGSEVWLNAQSELSYPREFIGKERTVKLSGEAYFKVVSDRKNRFNVLTPYNTMISAFGTEFNVNAYPEEEDSQITLARGKIEVVASNSGQKEMLQEGQKIILSSQTDKMKIIPADVYVETAWKDGKLIFRREKLSTIVKKLSCKYGASIQLSGETVNDYEYTATFANETLEEILDLLMRSAPITYSITKREQLSNNTFSQPIVKIKHK